MAARLTYHDEGPRQPERPLRHHRSMYRESVLETREATLEGMYIVLDDLLELGFHEAHAAVMARRFRPRSSK